MPHLNRRQLNIIRHRPRKTEPRLDGLQVVVYGAESQPELALVSETTVPANKEEKQQTAAVKNVQQSTIWKRFNSARNSGRRSRLRSPSPETAAMRATRDDVGRWLAAGRVRHLEMLLLCGKCYMIEELTPLFWTDDGEVLSESLSDDVTLENAAPESLEFLKSLPEYKQTYEFLLGAICAGDERTVVDAVDVRRCILARHPDTGASTVHLAVIHNRPRILERLLERLDMAPINARDIEGRTPLHYAAALAGVIPDSDSTCFDILIDYNADEEAADLEGYIPFDFFRMPKLIDMRQVQGLNQFPLCQGDRVDRMIEGRDLSGLKALVLDGEYAQAQIANRIFPPPSRDLATIMAVLNTRISAIQEAARDADFATFKQLVDSYEMATGRDEHGRTPLHIGVLHGREQIVRYLLLLFPNCVDCVDKADRTALCYAANLADAGKRRLMMRMLMRAGADPKKVPTSLASVVKAELRCVVGDRRTRQSHRGDLKSGEKTPLTADEEDSDTVAAVRGDEADQSFDGSDTTKTLTPPLALFDDPQSKVLQDQQRRQELSITAGTITKAAESCGVAVVKQQQSQQPRRRPALHRQARSFGGVSVSGNGDDNGVTSFGAGYFGPEHGQYSLDIVMATTNATNISDNTAYENASSASGDHNGAAAKPNENVLGRSSSYYGKHGRLRDFSADEFGDDDDDDDDYNVDAEVEERILSIDVEKKEYRELEELQFEGREADVWKVVKKHLSNERLCKYIYAYRQAQNRLNLAFTSIEENNFRKLKSLLDEELAQTRDNRGLAPLHMAVLRERHEMVEYIAHAFPKFIDIADRAGRTAAHYAAAQQNAIYDTLLEANANVFLPDLDGFTASRYRDAAPDDQMVQPMPFQSSGTATSDSPRTMKPNITTTGLRRNGRMENGRHQNGGGFSINSSGQNGEDWRQHEQHLDDGMVFDPDAPSQEMVERWLAVGDVQNLEQLVLDGRSHMLIDKSSMNLASAEFLDGAKIESIHKAVEDGDVRRVKSLIDRVQLSTARDRNGMTPLHKALLYGQTNTVRYLLAKYPQCVNCTDHAGRTPLHYAAADPNGEHMIKVLQKSGGDAFIEDKYGHTPFYYRTHGKRLNIRTLKDNAVINQLISGQLNRPLLQDLEEDISDWVHTGNVGKLEELVLNGYADLLLGRTHPIDDVDAIGFLEVLPQYQAKIQAIHKAIEQGNLRAVKLLTDRKKLALCRDGRGLAPLHKAIVFGRSDIAKYLIRSYPQSVNAMDQNKRTPLHYAAALRDGGYLYKLMRKAGADPNIFDCNGRPAKYYLKYPGELNLERMRLDTKQALKQVLHNRVAPSYLETNIQQWLREGNLNKLDQLVMSGCGDLLLDKKTNNPDASLFLEEVPHLLKTIDSIHQAIRDSDLDTVRQLITSKRLALARDRHGCTPLHTAIIYEQSEIIRYIAAHFPSVLNAPDYVDFIVFCVQNKRTAMHYAAAARDGGHYLKILGKAGADPMAVDNEGRTPDYYRRNAVFDLKLLKERDEDAAADEIIQERLLEADDPALMPITAGGGMDSPGSADDSAASAYSSGLESGGRRRQPQTAALVLAAQQRGCGGVASLVGYAADDAVDADMGDEVDRRRFERLLQEKLDLPSSDNGLYLARTVAPVLTKALAEVLLRRPPNPIGFISEWLIRYNEDRRQDSPAAAQKQHQLDI